MHSSLARPALALAAVVLAGCGAHSPRPRGLPLSFTVNRGQFAPEVRYAARAPGLELAATDAGLVVDAQGRRVPLRFAGGHPRAPLAGAALPGVANYLLGSHPRRWRTGVPTYDGVLYRAPWPGVDVAVYGAGGRLEYDVRLAPGADPGAVRLDFGDAPVRIDRAGALLAGPLRLLAPRAFQRGQVVESAYRRLADGTVGFRLGRYDRRAPLVIDPVLAYSTYLGGNRLDEAKAIAADASGATFVTGQTQSTSFPGAAGTPDSHGDAFAVKVAPGGGSLVWSTYFGGGDFDEGHGIAVAADGRALVAGATASGNFPTPGDPPHGSYQGHQDAFVAELSPTGALTWATYLGGRRGRQRHRRRAGPGGAYVRRRHDELAGPRRRERQQRRLRRAVRRPRARLPHHPRRT